MILGYTILLIAIVLVPVCALMLWHAEHAYTEAPRREWETWRVER